VDLAAETGGNIETTVKDEKIITDNGVTCLGYTDLASRLPTTSRLVLFYQSFLRQTMYKESIPHLI
jgi:NAD/NADP transhydrogenase alpha subunit